MKDEPIGEIGNQQETDIGWLSGIIDGEGYIGLEVMHSERFNKRKIKGNPKSLSKIGENNPQWKGGKPKRYFAPRISVANTDPAIIVKARDLLKSYGIGYYIMEKKAVEPRQAVFTIRIDRLSHIKTLLEITLPHLVGYKKAKGSLLLEYVSGRVAKGHNLTKGSNHCNQIPYSDREIEIASILDSWIPNDHTLPADILRRYDLTSVRKAESMAEMTMPTA